MPKHNILNVRDVGEDFEVEIVHRVRVPKLDIISAGDPAGLLIEAVKANLNGNLTGVGLAEAKEDIELMVGGVYNDIKQRVRATKDDPPDGKERQMF